MDVGDDSTARLSDVLAPLKEGANVLLELAKTTTSIVESCADAEPADDPREETARGVHKSATPDSSADIPKLTMTRGRLTTEMVATVWTKYAE